MLPILLLLLIVVPIIEISLFIAVGGVLGVWLTIALVLITTFVGVSLVRSQGIQTLMTAQARLQQGQEAANSLFEGVLLAIAGLLLILPGFMTDTLGVLLLLPPLRASVAAFLVRRMTPQSGFQSHFSHQPFEQHRDETHRSGHTFEGEFKRKNEEKNDDEDPHNRLH